MFGDRIEVSLTLKTLTSLHIGTGEFRPMPARSDTNNSGTYAAIVRDHRGLPYLPPTSVKGVIRSLAEEVLTEQDVIDELFGTIKLSKKENDEHAKAGTGRMGKLLFRGGLCKGDLPKTDAMPFANAELGKGAYIAARTAISGAYGVADDHKLFHQEMVPPGVTFSISLTLLEFGTDNKALLGDLKRVLSVAMRDGLSLGKSQADGQGQLAVSGVELRHLKLSEDGNLKETKKETVTAAGNDVVRLRTIEKRAFTLYCDMPFAVVDSSVKGAGRETAKETGTVQVAAQKLRDGMPLLHGSSIAGVLRSRAVWLSRLMEMRGELHAGNTAVKELFGTTDWKALVEIRDLKVSEAKEEKITSLKVDRFTGAPVFGALYTTAAFTGVRLSFSLVLNSRPSSELSAAAKTLFEKLCTDIRDNGLELGHGTNKGFGWFKNIGGNHGA